MELRRLRHLHFLLQTWNELGHADVVQNAEDGLVRVVCQGFVGAMNNLQKRILRNQFQREYLKIVTQVLRQHLDRYACAFCTH